MRRLFTLKSLAAMTALKAICVDKAVTKAYLWITYLTVLQKPLKIRGMKPQNYETTALPAYNPAQPGGMPQNHYATYSARSYEQAIAPKAPGLYAKLSAISFFVMLISTPLGFIVSLVYRTALKGSGSSQSNGKDFEYFVAMFAMIPVTLFVGFISMVLGTLFGALAIKRRESHGVLWMLLNILFFAGSCMFAFFFVLLVLL